MLKDLIDKGKQWIQNLNLFQSIPPTEDELILKKQRFSTRLFICLFISSLLIFAIYTSGVTVTHTITVKNPSYSKYKQLFNQYSNTLKCPCTKISIPYKSFLQLNAVRHEVCSSAFVQQSWFEILFPSNVFYQSSLEFRYTGAAIFQLLASLCQLSQELIDKELLTFFDTVFITADVMSNDLVIEQTDQAVNLLINNIEYSFLKLYNFFQVTTSADGPYSGLFTSFDYQFYPLNAYQSGITLFPRTFPQINCVCFKGVTCIMPAYIIISTTNVTFIEYVPGLFIGCYPIDGLLYSSLTLLYNQSQIDYLLYVIYNSSISSVNLFPALNSSLLQRSIIETPIFILIVQMFVEVWIQNISHENYFLFCQPVQCQYSYQSKNNLIVTITIVLGIVGGLNTILRFLSPLIIQIIFRIKNKFINENIEFIHTTLEIKPPLQTRIRNTIISIKNTIIHFNMFPSYSPSVHPYEIRLQRISTIFFIILMLISFIILSVFTALQTMTTTITINQPDYTTYQILSVQNLQSFSCLCTNMSIEQSTFIDIIPIFHPICLTDFVSAEFRNYILSDPMISIPTMFGRFNFIMVICALSNDTFTQSLRVLYETKFISKNVISNNILNNQIENLINNYIQTMINSFSLSFKFLQHIILANKLLNGFLLNSILFVSSSPPNTNINYITSLYPNCDCMLETCTYPLKFFLPSNTFFDVPGMVSGCSVLYSYLKSNIQCFFDLNCTKLFLSINNFQLQYNISALNSSNTKFSIDTPIGNLLENLFLEKWIINISYLNYFNQCKPLSCSYQILIKNNLITILTITIGLLGGIQIILKFIIPKFIKFIYQYFFMKYNNNNNLIILILNYNIFKTYSNIKNKNIYQKQIISTRIFIIIFIILLIIVITFNLFIPITKTININSPNYIDYLNLFNKYGETLECACKTIGISYSDILMVNLTFHQICSSVYIDPLWAKIIYASIEYYYKISQDFRLIGPSIFQTISSFCEITNGTIHNNLISFISQQIISNNIIEENIFYQQINSSFNLFIKSMESEFQSISKFFQNMIIDSAFVSLTTSNIILLRIFQNENISNLATTYNNYLSENSTIYCNCRFDYSCKQQAIIFNTIYQPRYIVPGMIVACLPVEAALQSTLICFYNQTCIDELRIVLNETSFFFYELHTNALDSSLPSRYTPNTKIEDIFNHLMIENISWNASYEEYYKKCEPLMCSYTIQTRNNPIYVLTLVLGLIGGLSSVLKVIIPYVVKAFSMLINRFCHRGQHQTEIHPF